MGTDGKELDHRRLLRCQPFGGIEVLFRHNDPGAHAAIGVHP